MMATGKSLPESGRVKWQLYQVTDVTLHSELRNYYVATGSNW